MKGKDAGERPMVDGWPAAAWLGHRWWPDPVMALAAAKRAVDAGLYPIYVTRHPLTEASDIWPLGEYWQLRTDEPTSIQSGAYYHGKPAYYIVMRDEEPWFSPEEDPEAVAHRQWLVRQEWERMYPRNHNETPC